MTLEDETGFVNVVLWQAIYAKHRLLAKTASFIGVTGKLQVQDGVTHLIAGELIDHSDALRGLVTRSRDFH